MKGGDKLQARLTAMLDGLKTASSVEVGWNKEATYSEEDGGLPVATVAARNEYGGKFTIPEHQTFIYRSLSKSGEFNRNGAFVKPAKSNFQTQHTVPAHDVVIPPRPFFRTMIAAHKGEWSGILSAAVVRNRYNAEKALDTLGEVVEGQLKQSIRDLKSPPNAPSTIARKGFDDPLIETGHMERTANHTVK